MNEIELGNQQIEVEININCIDIGQKLDLRFKFETFYIHTTEYSRKNDKKSIFSMTPSRIYNQEEIFFIKTTFFYLIPIRFSLFI